jgi:hypothetical protein
MKWMGELRRLGVGAMEEGTMKDRRPRASLREMSHLGACGHRRVMKDLEKE